MNKSSRVWNKSSENKDTNVLNAISRIKTLARLIDKKKGAEIIIFDLRDLSPITDYFVIANGLSNIHVKAIAESLTEYEKPNHVEGLDVASWVLLDYFDVIVHLFLKETREFYGLERLWGDATVIEMEDD